MQNITPTSQIEVVSPASETSQIAQAISHYGLLTQYVSRVLKDGIDYGVIPRTKKPTLYKAGAEKLIQLFQLRPEFTLIDKIQDWTGQSHGLKEPLFHFNYKCTLYYPKINGHSVGEGTGSCNSLEGKYRGDNWRFDLVHTLERMAIKRALVSAVLVTVGASEYFTADIEDWQNTINGTDPHEKDAAIARVGELVKQLGWSTEQAQEYLKQYFGVTGRKQLSLKQLNQLIEQLTSALGSQK